MDSTVLMNPGFSSLPCVFGCPIYRMDQRILSSRTMVHTCSPLKGEEMEFSIVFIVRYRAMSLTCTWNFDFLGSKWLADQFCAIVDSDRCIAIESITDVNGDIGLSRRSSNR